MKLVMVVMVVIAVSNYITTIMLAAFVSNPFSYMQWILSANFCYGFWHRPLRIVLGWCTVDIILLSIVLLG